MSAAYATDRGTSQPAAHAPIPAPTPLGKRGAYEDRLDIDEAWAKQVREEEAIHPDPTKSISQIERKLLNGQFRKETKKLADGRYYTFVVPGKTRSTYPFSEGIKMAGYTEYSKKLGIHCISAWGRPATDVEQERYETRIPRPHPSGRGFVYMGTHFPEGDAWGPRGQFGPKYGSNFTGD